MAKQSIRVDRELLIAELTKFNKRDIKAYETEYATWQKERSAFSAEQKKALKKILTAISTAKAQEYLVSAHMGKSSHYYQGSRTTSTQVVITFDESIILPDVAKIDLPKEPDDPCGHNGLVAGRNAVLQGLALSTDKNVTISVEWQARYLV